MAVRRLAMSMLGGSETLARISNATGVSPRTLRRWLRDGTAVARPCLCFRCDRELTADEATYGYLLGLYLGDGCISRTGRDGVFILRIMCSDSWPGLIDACEDAMRILGTRVRRVPQPGCQAVVSYSRHWPCFFPQHGPGRKHERPIVLERWQQEIVDRHPGEFLRGLFHSDGCRFMNTVVREWRDRAKLYTYPRYMFTNESSDIRDLCTASLDRLDIAWRYSRANTISVARRESVEKLDRYVGPKY